MTEPTPEVVPYPGDDLDAQDNDDAPETVDDQHADESADDD